MTDRDWMDLALAQARAAGASGEVPVGAVVVKAGELVAAAGNCVIEPPDPAGHAEVLALRHAARAVGNYRLTGCTLYVTLEPCPMCFGAIVHARIERLVFAATDAKTGVFGGAIDLPALYSANHRLAVTSGVCAPEAGRLLREFFRQRR